MAKIKYYAGALNIYFRNYIYIYTHTFCAYVYIHFVCKSHKRNI